MGSPLPESTGAHFFFMILQCIPCVPLGVVIRSQVTLRTQDHATKTTCYTDAHRRQL